MKCQICLTNQPTGGAQRVKTHIDPVVREKCTGSQKLPIELDNRYADDAIARTQRLLVTYPQHTAELTKRLAQLQSDPLNWLYDPEIKC